ncbi:F-box protein At5g67140-like isoform X2 [Zingiber officinale]|uniref:F-box protein At5g67140-like isoform X2 n=1 Tax=Zingiber officinale TaxID=94328 RepID=UPI001C4D68C6|nr:F-box protein At5g67140-like isoform X2 [Zingiber officinale]
METELEIERLPVDLLAHIFSFILSFKDLAQVCWKWRRGVKESLSRKERLSFAGWKVDDESAARVVRAAYNIKELDISRSCWGCQITDEGLYKISLTKCVGNLLSISMWGMAGITDRGVIQLVTQANSLQHLNIGGTFITDESLYAIANNCPQIKTIILWSCRHVTENGLKKLVDKCCKLKSINVWDMKVPVDCFLRLLAINPTLELKPLTQHLGVGRIWPAS